MSLDISLVPHGIVSKFLPVVLKHIETSAAWTRGRATADDILNFIFSGQMQLWVVMDGNVVYGHVITEVKQYPRTKMLVVQYCAMEPHHLAAVESRMQELAERFAKDAGCAGIEFVGRPGWSKSMKKFGYDVQSVMFQKFFK
jgi:hypothetical protein